VKQDVPAAAMVGRHLGWFGIIRLGLVQAALGAVVVLATSTMNRVMVVELALPAAVPGALVAFHYMIQIVRPRLGYGSDQGTRRTPWIVGGMAVLSAGGVLAACATALMADRMLEGIALALVAFAMIGVGVGAAGTSLLVLLAKQVAPARRAAAASIVWVMMIAGFAVTAGAAGHFLEPFSLARLINVTSWVATIAFAVTAIAVWGVESGAPMSAAAQAPKPEAKVPFATALADVWREPRARRFAIFVFVSMLGYSAQELILEPFAGAVLHLTPGESTKLTGIQHAGALIGMIVVALAGSVMAKGRFGSMRIWTISGCVGSAVCLVTLAAAGLVGPALPLPPIVFCLGAANGAFAVSAIGSMMGLAADGKEAREGLRMGLWGAAQAVAFALGGLVATIGSDLARHLLGSPAAAYATVFLAEAVLFLAASRLAADVFPVRRRQESSILSNVLPGALVATERG
jgi:BCD family chlorophyll transporter-like MFS transporter